MYYDHIVYLNEKCVNHKMVDVYIGYSSQNCQNKVLMKDVSMTDGFGKFSSLLN